VLITLTDFQLDRARDLLGAYQAGMRLRRAWPQLQGAVGLWLWAAPQAKRSGSVSVWESEEDLRRFVTWPVHVAIMHKYRPAGKLVSTSWPADRFDAAQVWQQAVRRLRAGDLR
jgi:hypothetical protein